MKKLCVLVGSALFVLSVHGVGVAADAGMRQPEQDVKQTALMPAERVQSADEIAVQMAWLQGDWHTEDGTKCLEVLGNAINGQEVVSYNALADGPGMGLHVLRTETDGKIQDWSIEFEHRDDSGQEIFIRVNDSEPLQRDWSQND